MTNNIVDRVGSKVTVWTQDGNPMENRTLFTLDTFGIVVAGYGSEDKCVFVPWCQVKYVDYLNDSYKGDELATVSGYSELDEYVQRKCNELENKIRDEFDDYVKNAFNVASKHFGKDTRITVTY